MTGSPGGVALARDPNLGGMRSALSYARVAWNFGASGGCVGIHRESTLDVNKNPMFLIPKKVILGMSL